MTPAEIVATYHTDRVRALVAELGDVEAVRRHLADEGHTPGEVDAMLAPHEPAPSYPGAPLTLAEAAVWQRARTHRIGQTFARWTGERWREDEDPFAEGDPVPAETTWTVVRPLLAGGIACKRWRRTGDAWGAAGEYQIGRWIETSTISVAPGVAGLVDLFERLQGDRRACLVRAIVARDEVEIPEVDRRGLTRTSGIRRMYGLADDNGALGGYLAPHPIGRRGLILDVDKAPAPAWLEGRAPRPEEVDRLIRDIADVHLPATWQGCELAYRWSQSAGTKDWSTVSLHLGVWLDRPVYDEPLRDWVSAWGTRVDPSTCGTVQPIYTAAPEFVGAPDPLEAAGIARVGRLPGIATVPLPVEIWAPASHGEGGELVPIDDGVAWHRHQAEEAARLEDERRARRTAYHRRVAERGGDARGAGDDAWLNRYCAVALARACERVAGASRRHDTLRDEALKIGGLVAGGMLDAADARRELLDAFIAVAGEERRSEGVRTINAAFARASRIEREDLLARRTAA